VSFSARYAIVVTTINAPTPAIRQIAREAKNLSAEFVIVGDSKSPANFQQEGSIYLSLNAQRNSGFRYGEIAPELHYARKNVGYLEAARNGATVIIETDDDNIPLPAFWEPRKDTWEIRLYENYGWINVYAWYSDVQIWPRGLPLDRVRDIPPAFETLPKVEVYCPIQQGLADANPDVDAIYRLLLPLPINFKKTGPVALRGAWCPFNSQNTTFFKPAFPLLYLPYYCSFRMTDIWRSFVAQRIAYTNGWGVMFHQSTVFQQRNEHDLMRDFAEEVPGYLHNQKIQEALQHLDLPAGEASIPEAMRQCYGKLVEMSLVSAEELVLLDAWLDDLQDLSRADQLNVPELNQTI
jgi:hypothetical protein